MRITAANYKVNGYSKKNVATIIVHRFSGQLKNWWDNNLTFEERLAILNHTIEELHEHEELIQDAYETLIHTIALHFIGNPQEGQVTAKTVLIKLRCPTIPDYRWYKDVFFTNVLKREDGMQIFWKERFITRLPKLFGEWILSKLRQHCRTDDISFYLLIFGMIFGVVESEGLILCSELTILIKKSRI